MTSRNNEKDKRGKSRIGPVQRKILLLLVGGLTLGLSRSPRQYFRIARAIKKEWQEINRQQLNRSIRSLYESKLVGIKEGEDGVIDLVLTEQGRERALSFNLDTMKIKRPAKWDGLWRIVTFDIPESRKRARDALRYQLKQLGLIEYQKSVFIVPFECRDEIEFLIEFFDLRRFVRFVLAKSLDNELHFKSKFKLI